jgi:hypothetical protein
VLHHQLGQSLLLVGRFRDALRHQQLGQQLAEKEPRWRALCARSAEEAQQLADLDERLPAVLKRRVARPGGLAELVGFAWVCYYKRLYGDSVRFFGDLLADKDAALVMGEKGRALQSFNAACAAAKAGSGQGEEAGRHDERQRQAWRKQGLAWLKVSLTYWQKQLSSDDPGARAEARSRLQFWRKTRALTALRDPGAAAGHSAEERAEVAAFWAEVERSLRQAELGKGSPRP